jgi:hypothetical protein
MANRMLDDGPTGLPADSIRLMVLGSLAAAGAGVAAALLFLSVAFDDFSDAPWRVILSLSLLTPVAWLTTAAVLVVAAVLLTALRHLRQSVRDDLLSVRPVLRRRLRSRR